VRIQSKVLTVFALLTGVLPCFGQGALMTRPKSSELVRAQPTSLPQPQIHDNVTVNCGEGDPLQAAVTQRKLAFRDAARKAIARGMVPFADGMRPAGAHVSASEIIAFMSRGGQIGLPWSANAWKYVIGGQLIRIRSLDNDTDMGMNEWLRLLYLDAIYVWPLLPNAVHEDLMQTLKAYQYWIDEPVRADDRRKQVFWSENHQIMYATIELLAGQLLPAETFRDGRTGAEHRDKAHARIERWLNDRLAHGFSEWNSPVYYEYEIMPLLNLVDFAEDERISRRAAMVLDLLIFDLARYTQRGSFGVTAGRVYGDGKSSGWSQSVGTTIEILFGTRYAKDGASSPAANALATTVKYCVPSALLAIGRDRPTRFIDRSRVSVEYGDPDAPGFVSDEDGIAWWGRGTYFATPMKNKTQEMIRKWKLPANLGADEAAISALPGATDLLSVFFEGMSLTRANLYTYRDPEVMLSSVQGFRPGQMGPQMHAWQATVDNEIAVWGTYPAALDSGDGPNWWTGNAVIPFVVQRESAAIAVYAPHPLGAQAAAFGHRTHLWFPFAPTPPTNDEAAKQFDLRWRFDEFRMETAHSSNDLEGSVWMFGKEFVGPQHAPEGEAYVGVYSAQPCSRVTEGTWQGKEIVCNGLRNAFVIQVGSRRKFGSFEQFIDACRQSRIYVGAGIRAPLNPAAGTLVSFDSPDPALTAVLQLDYGNREVRYGGQPFDIRNFPRFENPYTNTPWGATRYTIAHAGLSLHHDHDSSKRAGQGTEPVPDDRRFPTFTVDAQYVYVVRANGDLQHYMHEIKTDSTRPRDSLYTTRAKAGTAVMVQGIQPKPSSGAVTSVVGIEPNLRAKGTAVAPSASPYLSSAPKAIESATVQPVYLPGPPYFSHKVHGPSPVGNGWQNFRQIVPGTYAYRPGSSPQFSLLGLTQSGQFKLYQHLRSLDNTAAAAIRGPVDVPASWNWNDYLRLFGGGDGVVYAISHQGALIWHRLDESSSPARWLGPVVVANGGWANLRHAFSGGVLADGSAILYAITSGGALFWHRHPGFLTGAPGVSAQAQVGSGWADYDRVFSPGDGHIYALNQSGTLLWTKHEGFTTGAPNWREAVPIASALQNSLQIIPLLWGKPSYPIVK
jgi:hypothetical protein